MDATDTETAQESNWRRWTGDRGPFYRACVVSPLDGVSDGAAPTPSDEKPGLEVTSGLTRQLLRNLPTVLLVVLAIYVPTSTVGFVADGRLQPPTAPRDPGTIALVVTGSILATTWLYLIYRVVATPLRGLSMHRSVVFFGTALPLGAGTAYAVYQVATTGASTGEPAMTVQAGFFLFVLLAGHLVYDGLVLRTEHLFARLGETGVVDEDAYREFYEEMADAMGDCHAVGPVRVPQSIVFALVVALGPLLLPFVFDSFEAWELVGYVAYNLVTLFVLAVFYDVFVLVYYFVELLRQDVLNYQPFHPDEHGGFRDLGRFATRVNVILFVAGVYVAYRFYAEGVVRLSGGAVDSSIALLTWGLFYVGPILAYVCLVVFWLYHSFLRLHRKMEEGRHRKIETLQRSERETDADPPDEFVDLESDAPPWESLQNAPTWPIKRSSVLGIIVVDALPVVASFLL